MTLAWPEIPACRTRLTQDLVRHDNDCPGDSPSGIVPNGDANP